MKAEIIPVGTEILLGNIIDTNSSFLANQLPLLGVDLYFISTVGDNQRRLVDTLERAWNGQILLLLQVDWDPLKMILPGKLLANCLERK